jgi:hypothetical protein
LKTIIPSRKATKAFLKEKEGKLWNLIEKKKKF